ncbi:MAG: hypothetical protein CSA04_01365 [Bacteroidetes bacterium]|nr:MAG: hypothetical protein CSA04_01365 [Bacteroidota bacterium]
MIRDLGYLSFSYRRYFVTARKQAEAYKLLFLASAVSGVKIRCFQGTNAHKPKIFMDLWDWKQKKPGVNTPRLLSPIQ